MKNTNKHPFQFFLPLAVLLATLAGCGGGGGGGNDGPAIEARPQSIAFDGVNQLPLGGTASFRATASSGLEVRYASYSSSVCSVDSSTGLATAIRPGDCKITATQDGNSTYAPARATLIKRVDVDPDQTISFTAAPQSLSPGGYATVSAVPSSGLAVTYSSLTPLVCTVDPQTGSVMALAEGTCTIDAHQAGTTVYPVYYAKHESLAFVILPVSAPLASAWVVAEPITSTQARISFEMPVQQSVPAKFVMYGGGTESIAALRFPLHLLLAMIPDAHAALADIYTVVVSDLSGTLVKEVKGPSSPIIVDCPSDCSNYRFSVYATNSQGDGQVSLPAVVEPAQPPGKPVGVSATYGAALSEVKVSVGSVNAGGAPITGYKVTGYNSSGSKVGVVQSTGLPVTVTCQGSCTGYTFSVLATNNEGDGPSSDQEGITIIGTVPGKPSGVKATFGTSVNQVVVSVSAVSSGGSPITGFEVASVPAGVTASGTEFPLTVTCPGSCVGYAFSIQATNLLGDGPASDPADVITAYNIKTTWYEPATQPNDSIFTGSFVFNSTTKTVTELKGDLTQSMTTDDSDPACATIAGCPGGYGKIPMTTVFAQYQLKSEAVTLGGVSGLLVTTFVLNTTNTFYHVGGDGWSPAWGVDVGGIYYGWPKAKNPASGGVGNSSAMVFVNTADPMTPLTLAQINWTAYADCSPGGMMGAVCMTGTSIVAYGAAGTMGGYPHSQVITRK